MGFYFLMIYQWLVRKLPVMSAPASKQQLKQAAILLLSVMIALLLTKPPEQPKSYPILTKNVSKPCVGKYLFGRATLNQRASSLTIGNKQRKISYRPFLPVKRKHLLSQKIQPLIDNSFNQTSFIPVLLDARKNRTLNLRCGLFNINTSYL